MKNVLTREQAKALAQERVPSPGPSLEGDEFVIRDDSTIERSFGWVFFYDSRRHLETGDFRHEIAGNGPLMVNRYDGTISVTGTTLPIERYIAEYEARIARHPV